MSVVESIDFGIHSFIDFFSSTFLANTISELENFVGFLSQTVNTRSYKYPGSFRRGKKYDHAWGEPDDLFLVCATSVRKKFSCRVEVRGKYFRYFSEYSDQLDFLKELAKLQCFSPTRIDCTLDDYKRRFSYFEVKSLAEQGLFAPYESFHYHESGTRSSYKFGESISFGSRTSDRRLIFYDSDYVHEIPADRWEACFRREVAKSAINLLFSEEYTPAELLLGSFCLFKEKFSSDYIHPLWKEMQLEAGRIIEIKVSIPPTSFYNKLVHVRDKYSANFALFARGLGDQFPEFMDRFLDYGEKYTMSRRHRACLSKYKLQSEGKPFDLDAFFAVEVESDIEDDDLEFGQ